jgi:ribonuclease-3
VRFDLPKIFRKNSTPRARQLKKLLKKELGIPVNQIGLYEMAMRHKSAARNIYQSPETSNERLEFLGDAVLDTVVAEHLFQKYPQAEEGALTKMKSRIVSRSNLNNMAEKMGLSDIIETDLQASHSKNSIGGNALEALFGAMYIDLGYTKSRQLMLKLLADFSDLDEIEDKENDFKSRLFEEAHKVKGNLNFRTRAVGDHLGKKQFRAEAFLDGKLLGEGEGSSKKKAEQLASRRALHKLNTH